MISQKTLKTFRYTFWIATVLKCIPCKWNGRRQCFQSSKTQSYLFLANCILDLVMSIGVSILLGRLVGQTHLNSFSFLQRTYIAAISTSTALRVLTFYLEPELVAFTTKVIRLNVILEIKLKPTVKTDGLELRTQGLLGISTLLSAAAAWIVVGPNNPLDEDTFFMLIGGCDRYPRYGYGLLLAIQVYHNWILMLVAAFMVLAYMNSVRMWLQLINNQLKLGTLKMHDALKIYLSFQVCHQLFSKINRWTEPTVLIGAMVVFVLSAFPLIMFNSEAPSIHLLAFIGLCIVTATAITFLCMFCTRLTSASREFLLVLHSKASCKQEKLQTNALKPLEVKFNSFFAIKRQTLLQISRFVGDVLITWILAHIQSN